MTRQRSFKRLVRARMDKTGESYTAARARLLAADASDDDHGTRRSNTPMLPTSDDAIRQRTGRGWEAWFDLLDDLGAVDLTHREIARWLATEQGADPLAWNVQAVTVAYERARGGRAVGEHPDGFAITASKTVAVAVEQLFDAFTDPDVRTRWLPDGQLRERTATRPRTARFDWGDGGSRVNVVFDAKSDARSTVSVEHARLRDAAIAEETRQSWRQHLSALKAHLEAGVADA